MAKDKAPKMTQANKIVKYTHAIQQEEGGEAQGGPQQPLETAMPNMADLLLAINNSRN